MQLKLVFSDQKMHVILDRNPELLLVSDQLPNKISRMTESMTECMTSMTECIFQPGLRKSIFFATLGFLIVENEKKAVIFFQYWCVSLQHCQTFDMKLGACEKAKIHSSYKKPFYKKPGLKVQRIKKLGAKYNIFKTLQQE